MKFGFDWPAVLKKIFENGGGTDDDGQADAGACVYYKLIL